MVAQRESGTGWFMQDLQIEKAIQELRGRCVKQPSRYGQATEHQPEQ